MHVFFLHVSKQFDSCLTLSQIVVMNHVILNCHRFLYHFNWLNQPFNYQECQTSKCKENPEVKFCKILNGIMQKQPQSGFIWMVTCRIPSTDPKVRTVLHVFIIDSGSEKIKQNKIHHWALELLKGHHTLHPWPRWYGHLFLSVWCLYQRDLTVYTAAF